MKQLVIILIVAVFAGFSTTNANAQKKSTEVVCFKSNMDCENCQSKLTEYLKYEKGVKALEVDHVSNTIKVEYKAGKNNAEGVAKAIKKKGYVATEITVKEYDKLMAPHKGHDQSKGSN